MLSKVLHLLLFIAVTTLATVASAKHSCTELHRPFGSTYEPTEFPTNLIIALQSMNAGKPASSATHPDRLTANQFPELKPRHVVFLDTQAVEVPALKGKSAKFVLTTVNEKQIQMWNPETGVLAFRPEDLHDKIYVRPDFHKRSPFLPGEIIQIGKEKGNALVGVFNTTTSTIQHIPPEALPLPARFVGVKDLNTYIVELPGRQPRPHRLEIAPHLLQRMGLGTGADLKTVLRNIPHQNFSESEIVRFRLPSGHMTRGRILEIDNDFVKIQSMSGVFKIHIENVHRHFGPNNPRSIVFRKHNYPGWGMDLDVPTRLLANFLDGAAKIMSAPEVLSMPVQTRLEILINYQHILMPWSLAAHRLEGVGFNKMSEAICSGAGVCRHAVPLFAAILSEAGFVVRIKARSTENSELTADDIAKRFGGHTWLEVDVPVGKLTQTFVVDPSNGRVTAIERTQWEAKHLPESSGARFYAHPQSRTLPFRYLN